MIEYTIEPGQKNFKPRESWRIRFHPGGFSGSCILTPSCWWSAEDWDGDLDILDWRKIKGLTSYLSPNNRNSAMIAWRPAKFENTFEVIAYTNYPGKIRNTSRAVTVNALEKFRFSVMLCRRKATYRIWRAGDPRAALIVDHDFRRFCFMREVGTWFGGADNEPGEYGDTATKEMTMKIYFQIN